MAQGVNREPKTSEALPFEIICPQCHRLFTKELEDKEFVGHDFVEEPGEPVGLKGATRPGTWEPYFVRKEISRYRYRYKCKHCGHEWTEIKIERRNA
jgi:rubredoxin